MTRREWNRRAGDEKRRAKEKIYLLLRLILVLFAGQRDRKATERDARRRK